MTQFAQGPRGYLTAEPESEVVEAIKVTQECWIMFTARNIEFDDLDVPMTQGIKLKYSVEFHSPNGPVRIRMRSRSELDFKHWQTCFEGKTLRECLSFDCKHVVGNKHFVAYGPDHLMPGLMKVHLPPYEQIIGPFLEYARVDWYHFGVACLDVLGGVPALLTPKLMDAIKRRRSDLHRLIRAFPNATPETRQNAEAFGVIYKWFLFLLEATEDK